MGQLISKEYKLQGSPLKTNSATYFKQQQAINTSSQKVSLFVRELKDAEPQSNAIKMHKTLRHPGLLKYISSQTTKNGVCVVTEQVTPLSELISSLSEDEICLGIYSILKTLVFIHSSGLIHGDLRIDSVFCRLEDNKWLLGNLEFVTEPEQINEAYLKHFKEITSFSYPEDKHQNYKGYGRDYYGIGRLIDELKTFVHPVHFSWDNLYSISGKMTSHDTDCRPSINDVLQSDFFSGNILIQVMPEFLTEIRALSVPEKKSNFGLSYVLLMFRDLSFKLRSLPEDTIEKMVFPILLTPEIFAEPGSMKYPESKIAGVRLLTSKDTFVNHIIPFIEHLFTVRQYEVRANLLRLFNLFIDNLIFLNKDPDRNELFNCCISEILTGLDDLDDDIYYLSLCGLGVLIPKYYSYILTREQEAEIAAREGKDINNPAKDKSSPQGKTFEPQFSVIALVEDVMIPHVLKLVAAESLQEEYLWPVLLSLISVWKTLALMGGKIKKTNEKNLTRLSRSLLKTFLLILKAISPEEKVQLFSRFIQSPDYENDTCIVLWFPIVIEVCIPFLKDDNRNVRKCVSEYLGLLNSSLSQAMDRAPTINRRRETGGILARLRSIHSSLTRKAVYFRKAGPRQDHARVLENQDTKEPISPIPVNDRNSSVVSLKSRRSVSLELPEIEFHQSKSVPNQTLDDFYNDEATGNLCRQESFEVESTIAALSENILNERLSFASAERNKHYDRLALAKARGKNMGSDKIPLPVASAPYNHVKQKSIPVIPLVDLKNIDEEDEEVDQDLIGYSLDQDDVDVALQDVKL